MLIQANLGSVLYPKLALLPRLVKLPAEAAGNNWKPKLSPSCTMNSPLLIRLLNMSADVLICYICLEKEQLTFRRPA
jgi:hypothetical protein